MVLQESLLGHLSCVCDLVLVDNLGKLEDLIVRAVGTWDVGTDFWELDGDLELGALVTILK